MTISGIKVTAEGKGDVKISSVAELDADDKPVLSMFLARCGGQEVQQQLIAEPNIIMAAYSYGCGGQGPIAEPTIVMAAYSYGCGGQGPIAEQDDYLTLH